MATRTITILSLRHVLLLAEVEEMGFDQHGRMEYKPLAYELYNRFASSDESREGLTRMRMGALPAITFDQRTKGARKKRQPLTLSQQLDGINVERSLAWSLAKRHASITQVQSAIGIIRANVAKSLTITQPTQNNLIITGAGCWAGGDETVTPSSFAITTPGGFTNHLTNTQDPAWWAFVNLQSKVAGAAEGTTVTVTGTYDNSTPDTGLWVGEYSGLETTTPFDVGSVQEDDGAVGGTVATGDTVALSQASNLAVSVFSLHFTADGARTYTDELFTEDGAAPDADFHLNFYVATKETVSTGGVGTTFGWVTPTDSRRAALVGTFKAIGTSLPINTVPDETRGIFVTSDFPQLFTDVSTAIVVTDASGLTTCRLWCTSGDLTVTLSGSVVISAGANGSSDLTLGSGASTAEFNTVLATTTYQGDPAFTGKDTINVVSTGPGGVDTDTFYVLNDPQSLTITPMGTQDQLRTVIESLQVRQPVGTVQNTIHMIAHDAQLNSTGQTFTTQSLSVVRAPMSTLLGV